MLISWNYITGNKTVYTPVEQFDTIKQADEISTS
jgi:hypothetical protein